ncbi:MAG: cupredoxin domain-containing protein [Burkholderiales bacterium]|nr:cupredoxin domain-containing protein [Burkholderiales bacterium]
MLAGAATAGGLAGLSGVTAAIAADAVVDVEIKGNLFVPEAVTITPGTTVRWTNHERRTTHSVLFPAESLESERLLPGDSWQRKFDKPGRHPYTCGPHAEMKGLVVAEQVPFPPK